MHRRNFISQTSLGALGGCVAIAAAGRSDAAPIPKAPPLASFEQRYDANKHLQGAELMGKVRNLMVLPRWIGQEDRFWIKLQEGAGHRFYIVEAATGKQRPAFDHEAVAKALSTAGMGEQRADALPLLDLAIEADERVLTVGRDVFRCKSDGSGIRKLPNEQQSGWRDPAGNRRAFIRDHNVWVRDLRSGAERRVTEDGTPQHAYGQPRPFDFTLMARRRSGESEVPEGVFWSPDGKYLIAFRVDSTNVPERTHLCEYAAPDLKFTHALNRRIEVSGDHKLGQRTVTIVDLEANRVYPVSLDAAQLQDYAWFHAFGGIGIWWHTETSRLFIQTANWLGNRYGIAEVALTTGRARVVLEEAEEHWYALNVQDGNRPNVRLISRCSEAIWYSQRSGYGHLYLYDVATGKLKNAITRGDWTVYDLLHVDERSRVIYFTAGGREAGRNPYYKHLYRVSLAGGEPKLLTPEDADHEFSNGFFPGRAPAPGMASIAPSGSYFIDAYSTVLQPPIGVLRRSDGTLIREIYRADISALREAAGWRFPEPIVTLAADGQTELHGVMYKPHDFDAARRYPIVDMTYPGPQGKATPTNFMSGFQAMIGNPQLAANLGMIVVAFDGRGCGGRSRAFRYAFAGKEDVFGSADHVAGIKHLAARFPFMDVDRVGISGVSYGGYGALRAQLLNGDFFKACVSAVGPTDWRSYSGGSVWSDRYFRISDDPEQAEKYYQLISNVRLADRLLGKLLLIYGEIDESVSLNHAFLMFEGLQKAGKDYDTLLLTNQGHLGSLAPYGARRTIQFLVEHLQAGSRDQSAT